MEKESEITTVIGSLCTCASLRVWECVVTFFVNVVDLQTLLGAKLFWFLCRPDGLKVPTKQ